MRGLNLRGWAGQMEFSGVSGMTASGVSMSDSVWLGGAGVAAGVAFLISLVSTAIMRRLAPAWGFVDRPNARKVHATPIPLGGGVAVWLGVFLPLAAILVAARVIVAWPGLVEGWLPANWLPAIQGISSRTGELAAVLLGGTLLVALGVIDDLRNLSWKPKLLVQFLVAGGVVASGTHLTLFSTVWWVGPLVTVFWIVVLTNAFNFLDNMDALSSGIALIASVHFVIVMLTGTSEPRWFVAGFLAVLAASLGGFLVHNWPPAKIFMGDAGSCFIGFALATQTVQGTFYDYEQDHPHVLLAPLCILAVPLYDFTSVILIRLRKGLSPFHADKNHFSHRLVELGLSKKYAVLTIHLITVTTGLGGLLLYQVEGWVGAGLIVAMVVCLLAIIAVFESAALRAIRQRERAAAAR
jgi:UDP-GlcNAc:undecaprenyl-phosphate/decaprenyl-phosphate GlcNAc-1-phosphate transferase